ncbi:MAG: chromosome segregation protein SMC [Candidatus Woesearchaeota archaeon]
MTRVTRLVLEGFKTFAKRTEFIFGERFNVVLGPNGSGKSNVLDAFCFVLGRASAKSMRAEKSSSLIYNGGKLKNPAPKAEVSIFFDNSDKSFPVDTKEVKITRIVKQNGQGTYKINDRRVTRNEVLELLAAARIDPDGYNIVLQGEINDFVEMSPIQRRMLIEEIAGISVYEEKKQKAISELQKVDERIKQAEIILAEKEAALSELKKDREQALKYKDLKEKIDSHKAAYLSLIIEKRKKEIEKAEAKISEAAKEIEGIQKEISEVRSQIEEKKKLIEKIRNEINEKAETDELALNREVEELKVKIATLQTGIESHKKEIEKLQEKISSSKKEVEENTQKISQLNSEVESARAKHQENLKQIEKINRSIEEFRKKHKLEDVAELQKEMEKIDSESEAITQQIQKLNEEKQSLLREKDKLEVQISTIEQQIQKVIQIEKEHADELEKLKDKKEEFKRTILEINRLLTEASSTSARLAEARARMESVSQALQRARIKSTIAKEGSRADAAVQKVLEQKGKIPGIIGSVAELGNAPSKYALALEVAAANRIRSIVVENEDSAIRCIRFLRENKFGVATFIPLSKIKVPEIDNNTKQLASAKGVFGFAYELIECDKKFKKVFEHVFADTLVVENSETAKRLGIGNARMVTLEGDLFERSGLITGGFRQRENRGGFAEKESVEELQKLEKSYSEATEEVTKLEGQKKALEDRIAELREKKASLEGEIIRTEKSLHLESSDLEVSKRTKELLQEDIKKKEQEIKAKDAEISKTSSTLAKIKSRKQELRIQINSLQDPVLIAELTAFEQNKSSIREENVQLEIKMNSLLAQLDILKNSNEKIEKAIRQTEKEIDTFQNEIEKMSSELKTSTATLKEKEELQRGFRIKFRKLYEQQQTLSEEISKAEAEIQIKEDRIRQIEMQSNNLSLKKASLTGELIGLEKEFEPYKNVVPATGKSEAELKYEFEKYEKLILEMGAINLKAIEVYDAAEKQYNELLEKKSKLSEEKESVIKMIQEIEGKKLGLFMKTYEALDANFKKFFSALTVKGEAFLEIENKENPIAEDSGVTIKVKITQNKFLDIRSLSGGEKSLTALAFIFAIQEFEPAPFYLFDEVDAALDKRNSEKLAKLIKQYSARAQYIVISHNDAIISEGDVLYGISMDVDKAISTAVSLNFEEAKQIVKEEQAKASQNSNP